MPRGGTSHADAVAACLRNGRWAPRPGGPRSVASLEDESWIHKYKCQDLRMTVEHNQWTPDDPRCNELLELDYKTARFDGLFADPERPIEYSMVAESIAETISVGLKHAGESQPARPHRRQHHLRYSFPQGDQAVDEPNQYCRHAVRSQWHTASV